MKNYLFNLTEKLFVLLCLLMPAIVVNAQTHPGGIAGSSVWLRADQDVNASGTNVNAWTNQSGAPHFTANGNPQLVQSSVNFNPGIHFNGNNYLTSAANVLPANNAYTKFVVFKYDGVNTNNIVSSGPGGNNAFFGSNSNTNLVIFHAGAILTATNVVNSSRYFMGVAGFSSGVAAGTFINVDGTTRASINSSAPYVASTMQLGAHANGNRFTGRIAEVIVYPSALGNNSTATRQIQSYLAVKYGITLSHDYIASDGITTTYTTAGFGYNVAGIGRDNNSALHQKQSRSLNANAQVTIALGEAAASNLANTNTITNDKQFLIWGDNNGSISTTSALTGWTNTTTRLTRIWKLQNTGNFNQQVTVYFPTASLNVLPGGNPYLIYNNSNALNGGGTEVPASTTATIGGVAHTGFTVTFPASGELYFSFASKLVHPGAVTGAAVWLRADAGLNTSGNNVTTWINQVNANNSFTATANPQLVANSNNFQPGVQLNGSNYLTSTSNVLPANSPYTKFVVYKYDGTANTNILSSGEGGNNAMTSLGGSSSVALWHSGEFLTATGAVSNTRHYLVNGGFTRGLANGAYINVDGVNRAAATSNTTYVASTMQVGAHRGGTILVGRVAEVIAFPSSLGAGSDATRRINSYLGVKYGITLGHDYLASDGTTTYTVSGYASNIAGIGRDDATALYQKQGKSGNSATGQVVMSLGTVAATNAANTETFTADKQFLIWGDNNGAVNSTVALTGWSTVTARLARVWKLQNTGGVNQPVTVYFPLTNLNALPGTRPYLIYNTSTTLDGGGTEVAATTTTTIGGVQYKGFEVTFPATGTLYFSFASRAVNPGNVPGAAVWLRPDAGINANGANITGWINQVNPANSFTGTGNPQLAAGNVNFQPGVVFNGSNYLTSAANVLTNNGNYTKFVVFKYDGVNGNNLVSSGTGGTHAFFGNNTTTDLILFHQGAILTASNVVNASRYYLGVGSFANGAANGTYISVDGTNRATGTSSAAYVAAPLRLGAHAGGSNNLNGRISEVIVYPTALATGAVTTRQIQSYLGLKYGITLGHDYIASDGSTVTYSIASHANNIAGIGRDDDEALHQVQSQSISAAANSRVVMAVGSIAATHADNTNTITNDKQWLVWGDDNASVISAVPVTGFDTVNNRLTRVWKLQNTGSFNQQVTVYFPTASLNILSNAKKYLIYNTDPALAGPGTEVAASTTATINGVAHTGFELTFPTTGTLYFSFGSKAVHPGNVPGAAMWVRADAGVNTNGANITEWINQVNASNNFIPTANPQLTQGIVNFNPSVTFNGSNYLTSQGNVPATNNSNYTKFIVFRAKPGTNNLMSALVNTGTVLFAPEQSLRAWNSGVVIAQTPNGIVNPGRQYLSTVVFNSGVTDGTMIRLNGVTSATATSSAPHTANRLNLGAYINGNIISDGSNIAEAIVYSSALTEGDARKVESYLGLKYGLTLNNDYLASDGSTVYTAGSYNANIAGIGRDDNTALDQRQSQSVNPGSQAVMAAGDLAATNADNTHLITGDLQYLVWGDDDAPGYNYNTGISQKRLARVWRLQNSNSFNQALTVYYPVTGLYGLGNAPELVYGSLASLDDGTATRVSVSGNVTINGEEYRSFQVTFPVTGELYFSFAGEIVPEICANGIDDDLDEYIDELDAGCTPVPSCVAAAPPLTNFAIKQDWFSSTAGALAASVSPTVADLDGDGIPEVITVRAGGAGLTYFKGDGSNRTKNSVDYNIQLPIRVNQSTMQPAVADVDRDGLPEVIVVGEDRYVYVFNNVSGSSTVYKYRSEDTVHTRFAMGSPRISDINEDGIPEIVVGLDVFQFNFGESRLVKVVKGSDTAPFGRDGVAIEWGNDPVVIDIMPSNPGKEIVAGSQVYGLNLSTGEVTVLADLSAIAGTGVIPANNDGPTAVADLDYDGQLDIVYPNGTHIVVWDPVAATLKMNAAYVNNGILYMGMPTIANVYDEQAIDGASGNLPEIIFNVRNAMHAFNLNNPGAPVWTLATADASAETGVTAFDLNGDGVQEIIYNDQVNIRVINGNTKTPADVATFASGTATWMEHPVVVDVDNDGGAEFVCVAGPSNSMTGQLRVFGPANGTSPWQSTRTIWNGRGYRPKAIIDDLTIPVKEQDITVQYPPGSGKYPIDVFNCQIDARLLDPGISPVSDLFVSGSKVLNSETSCNFNPAAASLEYTISNNGAAAGPEGTPVRFYLGDPRQPGAVLLAAVNAMTENLAVGASVTDTVVLDLSAHTAPYTIFTVVNDDGSATIPIALPIAGTNVKECDYGNNFDSVTITPVPADFGNLPAEYAIASAAISTTNAAWLGTDIPDSECGNIVDDGSDGVVVTSGAKSGDGSNAVPWVLPGVGSVAEFTLTINGNGTPKPVYWAMWYDADGNGSFTDALDDFQTGSLVHGSPVTTTFSITVPPADGATNGAIRVIATAVDPSFTKDMNGEGVFINGEVEDYFINYVWPLPVVLEQFTAYSAGNCTAQLEWKSTTEINNDRYEVQRSTNGRDYQTIGSVVSYNSATGGSYSYTDNEAIDGDRYYRLHIVDINGSSENSKAVRVRTVCNNGNIKLTPNPVTSVATITGLTGGETIRVMGSDGREHMSQVAYGGTLRLNMDKLAAGVYMVQVIRGGKIVSYVKVTRL
jgi:hypothetical protein